ncbi:hypothetical protein [Nitrosomonas sp. Nm132]|uniref:hypothetical protein n=1 Tax=Nitrosomonas sp. Nm132 TaxID=1881053 RepID=UPI00088F9AE3|nr:hypothetical protein [Nitrosomonas sp. Nm132]SDG83306.1 hypothetical protein SAMN05428952_100152 [Nitrosomonas sp. Nm132]
MFLTHELINDAITKKIPIKKLFNSSIDKLLDNYVVSDYVIADHIPEIILNGGPAKESARFFFEKYRFLAKFDISNILVKYDFVSQYDVHKKFPYEFLINFFDTFIVVEIAPSTLHTEYVLISPNNKSGDNSLGQVLDGLTAATSIMALFSNLNPGAQVALHIKIGQLLEYLRSGVGKKKRFGIF